ncbi:MAG: hypothetical protein V4634_00615 [Pseudomonadota bacterium]
MILPVQRLRQFTIARAVAGFLMASNAGAQTLFQVAGTQQAHISAVYFPMPGANHLLGK